MSPACSAQPFPVRRVHEIEPRSPTDRWLVDGLLGKPSVAIIGGPPKAFKTWLAAELALAVASGTKALGRFTTFDQGPVLFFGAEDPPPDLRARFEGIASARKIDLARIPLLILDLDVMRLDDRRHLDQLHATVAIHAPRLLVLDPFVRLVAGLDENSARDVSSVLGALRTLQRDRNVSILLVHHMRKSPAAHPAQQLRGSGDFSAWADNGLYLTRRNDERVLLAEHRAAPAPPPLILRLAQDGSPHLDLQDAPAAPPEDPLEARVLELLATTSRPQSTLRLRDALRVRKAALLVTLRALSERTLVEKTEHGWALIQSET